MRTCKQACVALGLLCPALGSTALFAQSRELVGVVVDDASQPVRGAKVTIRSTMMVAESRATGEFNLAFPPGDHVVHVVRLGHRPAAIRVSGESVSRGDTLHVRLDRAPTQLLGVLVPGERTVAFGQTVTRSTIRQLAPLGEPDVMRALPLLPGVLQPNDMLGRVHLAGSAGDESLFTLDGHPMQSPMHLSGIIGGFNVGAIDRVEVVTHHVPATVDSRLGGVIALESRERTSAAKGEAVATLLASSVTAYTPSLPTGIDLLASGRITYMDQLHKRVYGSARAQGDLIPSYGDGLVRVGTMLGAREEWSVDAIGYLSRDWTGVNHARGDLGRSFTERLAGLRLKWTGDRTTLRVRVSDDHSDSRIGDEIRPERPTLRIDQRLTSAALVVDRRLGQRANVNLSLGVDERLHRYGWTRGAVEAIGIAPNYLATERQTAAAVGAELEILFAAASSLSGGARLHAVAGGTYLAPRLHYSRSVGIGRLDLAVDRRLQFDTQFGEPIDGKVPPVTFLIDRPRSVNVGAATYEVSASREGRRWFSLSTTVFMRTFADRTVPVHTRDTTFAGPVSFLRTKARSVGFANGLTTSFGRSGVVQGSYTFASATQRDPLDGEWIPSGWDSRHSLALLGSVPIGRRWTFNATFQMRSGLPVTPIATSVLVPNPFSPGLLMRRLIPGEVNSGRLPGFRRLDIGLRRRWAVGRLEMDLMLQVVNVLAADNALAYDWDQYTRQLDFGSTPIASRAGVPLVPSIGFEVRW